VNNTNMAELERKLGYSRSTIHTWKNSKAVASDKLIEIADYFNVSTDYLLGITDIPTKVSNVVKDAQFERYLKLPESKRKDIDRIISVSLDIITKQED
jgi:transcriptional regulator with XRE-family HTH domain